VVIKEVAGDIALGLHHLHRLLVLALDALALGATLQSRAVALTIFFEAMTFEALALDLDGYGSAEELLAVSAVPALALRTAGLSQFETLAVVLQAACLHAGALADQGGFGVRAGGSRAVGGLEFAGLIQGLCMRGGLIVIVEGSFFEILGL
jgi:hypothetical protein